MATATVSTPVGAPRSLNASVQLDVEKVRPAIPQERAALYVGLVVGAVLFVIGALNLLGTLNTAVWPGESPGANPAIDFFVLGTLAVIGPFGFLASAHFRRISRIESRLPDFLRDVAEAGRFGMTLPDAIIVASKGRYDLLTGEIKKMASQLEWGVPVATALSLFKERVNTPLVNRTVSIIIKANEAGGNVADVLSMVARDTRDVQITTQERQITMLTYLTVIYISFYVFLVTIYIMAAVFLPQMLTAGSGIASTTGTSAGGAGTAISLNFTAIPELFLAFLVAVIVHAIGDGIMAGVIINGRMSEGFQHATIMLASGWLFMRLLVPNLVVPGVNG
ncbi:MAG TPA: type II secretion system F family protein [Thermoplasmata archaeon]|nr:type II secretion system F family protein [Thermoplasmata archaeon]